MSEDKKYTDGATIDWSSITDPEKQIDWDNINFLTHESSEGKVVIKRHPSIPQLGGLVPILAYRKNFLRYLKKFPGGKEISESFDDGLLWDMSMTLARGGEIPFGTQAK